jgi:hypothetical protein
VGVVSTSVCQVRLYFRRWGKSEAARRTLKMPVFLRRPPSFRWRPTPSTMGLTGAGARPARSTAGSHGARVPALDNFRQRVSRRPLLTCEFGKWS